MFDDRLLVNARCLDVRGARFRFEYAITRDGVTIADGWTRHGTVDATTLRPTRLPAWLVEAIATAEARAPSASPASTVGVAVVLAGLVGFGFFFFGPYRMILGSDS